IYLFLMVLILGQRRLRRFEWLLFALMAALFMWNSGNLLALNLSLAYGAAPAIHERFARLIPFLGAILCAPLVVHVHTEYAFPLPGSAGRVNAYSVWTCTTSGAHKIAPRNEIRRANRS